MRRKIITIVLTLLISLLTCSVVFADWVKDGNRYKYMNSGTGQYVVNNWLQTGNGFYYLDANGYTVIGWYLINGKYYYFNENGLMQVGFLESGGKTYYLDNKNGAMVTGWIETYKDGVIDYYYFGADGAMYKGWQKINNKWYYFYEGKCIVNTFAQVNGIWYHFNVDGSMDTGWVNENGKMYYFNLSDGSLLKGWIQDQSGNEYYLSEVDGSLAVNITLQIGGVYYTFDSTGKCINKNNYSFIGDFNGNTEYLGLNGYGNKGQSTVYGVNVGAAPGSTNGVQGTTSFQLSNKKETLAQGQTTGPQ